jgi:hypothetical protein
VSRLQWHLGKTLRERDGPDSRTDDGRKQPGAVTVRSGANRQLDCQDTPAWLPRTRCAGPPCPARTDQTHVLRDARSRHPPHQSFVRLAAFDRDQPVDALGHGDLHRPGYLPTAIARATQFMGHVAWEVVIAPPTELERFVASCPDSDALTRIWPPQLTTINWPSRTKLVLRDILTLRIAWNERCWPPSPDGRLPSPIDSPRAGLIVAPPASTEQS